ncbi:hypothetical protein [Clostridium felsineum]|uniref:hypothetical protein n=1 Tax=Clostridium felsineum TaxID=36839 RepID=UPI00098C0605|nr:hypothetical protein [Clostridium felsineum]URZ16918.1 hypothetical protein CLFE_029650 [Clostridium felsineum DSM 794]
MSAKKNINANPEKYSNIQYKEGHFIIHREVFAKLKPIHSQLLTLILNSMNAEGQSIISLATLGKHIGYSESRTSLFVNELLEMEVNGRPIIYRTKTHINGGQQSLYTCTAFIPAEPTLTPKDALLLFAEEYKKEFGVDYKINWARDTRMVKRLFTICTEEQLRNIITVSVQQYRKRWASPQYPTPTIGAMCSWIYKQAIELATKEEALTARRRKFEDFTLPEDFTL